MEEDLLAGIDENNLPEVKEKGLLYKVFIIVMGLFIAFLFVSYLLVGPHTMDIISGMFESDIVDEGRLVLVKGNATLAFSGGVYGELKQMYLDNPRHEFKACLHGSKDGSSYFLTEVAVPETFEQKFDYVVAKPCTKDALVDLHSHPEKHCIPSYHDVKLLERLRERNPGLVMAVMCGVDRFTFYV